MHPCDAIGQGDHPPFDFKGHIYSSNEVVLEGPPLDYTDMGNDDDEVREYLAMEYDENDEEYKFAKDDEHLMEAFDNARNGLVDRVDNQTFPLKKSYRLVFPSSVHLSAEVLDAHKEHKDSSKLHMRPLPIEYVLDKQAEAMLESLTWEDVETKTVELYDDDMFAGKSSRDVLFIPQPMVAVQRFVIELADLNKDSRKKGKIVKAADAGGVTAMMAALNKKKGKKKKANS